MLSSEMKLGRVFGVTFEDGEDFMESLTKFFKENNIKQAYIPSFVGGFSEIKLVGTWENLEDPDNPIFGQVELERVEALGCGTLAYDERKGVVTPHVHVTVGTRLDSLKGYTGHLLGGKILLVTEILLFEVLEPTMMRVTEVPPFNVLKYVNE
ncbi:PCC domain-containing protein [Anaerosacchariphilus polymeriproducens]|uniref:DUF296 domain-containing protein n=1 Tax=Anaerosacchariphilus polymeriproducens TaxID=1812858 RepID=A0A371AY63_9FIRM|nr:DUF296 domain-containing protein [Anaerosacchariphilus polymeriproducens]RDU24528.1 DUF296 domain-containing protein [Anaerosacchariphilus polymeriproducens]